MGLWILSPRFISFVCCGGIGNTIVCVTTRPSSEPPSADWAFLVMIFDVYFLDNDTV